MSMLLPALRRYQPCTLPLLVALLALMPGEARADQGENESDDSADAAAAAPAGAVDACALLTKDEIAKIAGSPYKSRRPHVMQYPDGRLVTSSCTYRTRESRLSAEIIVERGRTPQELAGYVDNLKKAAEQSSGKPMPTVPGFGDEAHWGQIGPNNGMLHVIRGTDVLTVRTYGEGPGAGALEKTKEVMALVYPRFVALPAGGAR